MQPKRRIFPRAVERKAAILLPDTHGKRSRRAIRVP